MSDLTERQQAIYEYIVFSVKEKGYPPTVREICSAVGLRSPSTVHSHLATLEEKRYIKRNPSKGRAIELLRENLHADESRAGKYSDKENIVNIPLVGRVTAGEPVLATENVEDVFPLPKQVIRGKDSDATFLLRIEGDSMIEDGIFDGDFVIVNRQQYANDGDIVVALVGDEDATVKRIYREDDRVRLQPANQAMQPIYSRNVQILGQVVGLLRTNL